MDSSGFRRIAKKVFTLDVLKGFLFYILFPVILLVLLAEPIGNTARRSNAAAWGILAAALAAIAANWAIYRIINRKNPTTLVYTHGLCCLLAVGILEQEALPGDGAMAPVLSFINIALGMLALLVFSFWLASLPYRPAHAVAVTIRAVVGVGLFLCAWQVVRQFECGQVTLETGLTIAFIIAMIVAFNSRKLIALHNRNKERRRKTGRADGLTVQVFGESFLDREEELDSRYYAIVEYTVDGKEYETRADISRYALKHFGRKAFIGLEVDVFYDPSDPADTYVKKLNQYIFDSQPKEDPETAEEALPSR